MKLGVSVKVWQQNNIYCRYDNDAIAEFSANMLTPQYWQTRNAITGSAQGRGTTWFVCYQPENIPEQHWVLRHYYRGGLIGKLINDSYWFSSQRSTRAAREFDLLAYMQTVDLPAPKPLAYRVVKHGLIYQADLLSSRIEHAQDLVAILSKQTINESLWEKIGITIKGFHDENIYHHDLNAHNILINNKDEVFLIDFDRGEMRSKNQQRWQQANMNRLHRSFMKEQNKLDSFHFSTENWRVLLEGYLSH